MKPLDEEQKYTLAEIEKAIMSAGPYEAGHCVAEKVLAKLPLKPKFAEGEIVYCKHLKLYHTYRSGEHLYPVRPLNQTEVGPGWVPKEDAKALLDAAKIAYIKVDDDALCALRAAVNDFDAKHGDKRE